MECYGEGFADVYDEFMDDVDYPKWGAYIAGLLASHGITPPARVADAACGTGTMTLELAKQGYTAMGLDLSGPMLANAGEKALNQGMAIPFIQQNICELETGKPVNAVVCACDGVNYLKGVKDPLYFFTSAFICLESGGVLTFDVSTPYKLEKVIGNQLFARENKNAAYIWQNSFDEKSRILTMDITFFIKKKGKLFERYIEQHIQRAHSDKEIKDALKQAGFKNIKSYDCFTKAAPKEDSERIQYVAVKP